MRTAEARRWDALRREHPWLLLSMWPLLLTQGKYVRWSMPRMREPDGPRTGISGRGPGLRLLITGDSAAAGVGVERQSEALSGQLARRLDDDFELTWQLEAQSGWTTNQAIEHLQTIPARPFDVAVISLGVNDITAGVGARAWISRQQRLADLLTTRFAVRHILFSVMPPVHLFPALPQPLRRYLGSRAFHYTDMMDRHLGGNERRAIVRPEWFELSTSVDGFHPGADVYSAWADALAACIGARFGVAVESPG